MLLFLSPFNPPCDSHPFSTHSFESMIESRRLFTASQNINVVKKEKVDFLEHQLQPMGSSLSLHVGVSQIYPLNPWVSVLQFCSHDYFLSFPWLWWDDSLRLSIHATNSPFTSPSCETWQLLETFSVTFKQFTPFGYSLLTIHRSNACRTKLTWLSILSRMLDCFPFFLHKLPRVMSLMILFVILFVIVWWACCLNQIVSFLSFVFLCFSTRRFALDYTPQPTLLYWSTYTHKNASSWMIRSSHTFIFVQIPMCSFIVLLLFIQLFIHSFLCPHSLTWLPLCLCLSSLTAKGVKLFLQRIYFFTAATFSRSVLRTPGRGSICLRSLRQWPFQSQFLPPQS